MTAWQPTSDTTNQPTVTLQRSAALLKKTTEQSQQMAHPRMLFAIGRDYHCHLFTTSLSHPNSQYPVDTWVSSEVTLAISLFHKTAFSVHHQHIWDPQRESLQQHSLVVTSIPSCAGVTSKCQIGRQLEQMKALALTSLSTFKALAKDGTQKKSHQFQFKVSPQINRTWHPHLIISKTK